MAHEHEGHNMQLSYDGVQESKSSAISLDTYSVKFDKCRNIYPIKIIKPYNRFKFNEQVHLKSVVNDLNNNYFIINDVICDNPKRSVMRHALCHSSLYACEYCESSAVSYVNEKVVRRVELSLSKINVQKVQIENRIENLYDVLDQDQINLLSELKDELTLKESQEKKLLKKKHLVWPSQTLHGQPRDLNTIKDISRAISTGRNSDEESEELCRDERKGIVGPSVFLNQANFNMINNIPAEYMHLACLGIVRRLLELTFKVGENRERTIKRKLCQPSYYNQFMSSVRVLHEFSRRGRHLRRVF